MKKLLKTKKLEVKTETVRVLTNQQLDVVAGGATVNTPSNTISAARCQTSTYQV